MHPLTGGTPKGEMRNRLVTDDNTSAQIVTLKYDADSRRMKRLNQTIKAVLFDLDGTLIDSAADLHAAAVEMLRDLGRPPLPLEQVKSFVGNGVAKLVERCLIAAGAPGDFAAAQALFHEHYSATPMRLSQLYPGVASALRRLRASGLNLGVCTNKPQGLAERILSECGLLPLLDTVVGANATRALKPDPAPLHECIHLLRAATAEALYVGDSETDEEAARRAAIRFALFSGGYRVKSATDMAAVVIFDHYDELANWVLNDGGN